MDKDKRGVYDKSFDAILSIVVKKSLGIQPLNDAEQAIFEQWYTSSEKNREIFHSLGENVKTEELITLMESDFAERQFKAVQKRIAQTEVEQQPTQQAIFRNVTKQSRLNKTYWYIAAASVAVLMGLFIRQNMNKQNQQKLLAQEISSVYMLDDEGGQPILIEDESISFMSNKEQVQHGVDAAKEGTDPQESETTGGLTAVATKTKTVVVPKGKEVNIVLPDGSKVWLGGNSTISFPEKFSNELREVSFSGEAFFDVVKDEPIRFVVTSSNIKTIVYGTEFYVTSLVGMDYTAVSLLTGSVEVALQAGISTMLQPGEKAVNYNGEDDFERQTFNVEALRAVKEGMFIFWGDKIKDIIPVLNNWYDYTISCDEEIENAIFYLKINKKTPIEDVLRTLSSTNRVGYAINTEAKLIKLTTRN